MNSNISKYLKHYACDEISIANAIDKFYRNVLVVPLFDETANFVQPLLGAADKAAPSLIIAIVNAHPDAPEHVRVANAKLIADLDRRYDGKTVSTSPPAWLFSLEHADVLCIDRSSKGWQLPARQGVGLARRIGFDLSLMLHQQGKIASPWIFTTDADANLPNNYFDATVGIERPSALVYPYWHLTTGSEGLSDQATELYEISLRYFVVGLHAAGSAYAFHSIGSTIAVHGEAYATVRGIPRRQAGEDFYLLNKLAKIVPIRRAQSAPITLRQRPSTRVPFGTGRATETIARQLQNGCPFCLYHPDIFFLLGRWLTTMKQFADNPSLDHVTRMLSGLTVDLRVSVGNVLSQLGAMRTMSEAARQCSDSIRLQRRLVEWFDGFRTLKFIHALRDTTHPMTPWQVALKQAPFIPNDALSSRYLCEVRKRLRDLEAKLPL